MENIAIKKGYVPGAIGRVAELHGRYYHRHWGFTAFFEAKVATELGAFIGRFRDDRDGFWTAHADGRIHGAITIDGIHAEDMGAHLRWFITAESRHGSGMGNRLIQTAIAFCRERGYSRVFLWTFEGLEAARHLYEKKGFKRVEQRQGSQWGRAVNEQRFLLKL